MMNSELKNSSGSGLSVYHLLPTVFCFALSVKDLCCKFIRTQIMSIEQMTGGAGFIGFNRGDEHLRRGETSESQSQVPTVSVPGHQPAGKPCAPD